MGGIPLKPANERPGTGGGGWLKRGLTLLGAELLFFSSPSP